MISSVDLKTAFLQGHMYWDDESFDPKSAIFMRPPPEAFEAFDRPYSKDEIWAVQKSCYGLDDAPRRWYERLREGLINKYGLVQSKIDSGIFYYVKKGPEVEKKVRKLLQEHQSHVVDQEDSHLQGATTFNDEVHGIVGIHVDDLLCSGTTKFYKEIIDCLQEGFEFHLSTTS